MKVVITKGKRIKIFPENRVIIGEEPQTSLLDEFYDICTRKELSYVPVKLVHDDLAPDRYNRAKAKCDPMDEWNESTGIDIVASKLRMKEHLRKARKIEKALVAMNSLMRKMEDILSKHLKQARIIRKDLEDYYGGVYR